MYAKYLHILRTNTHRENVVYLHFSCGQIWLGLLIPEEKVLPQCFVVRQFVMLLASLPKVYYAPAKLFRLSGNTLVRQEVQNLKNKLSRQGAYRPWVSLVWEGAHSGTRIYVSSPVIPHVAHLSREDRRK